MRETRWTLEGVKAYVSDGSQDNRDIVLHCHIHQVINGYRLHQETIHLDVRKKFSTVRTINH